jgi:hypothetical protein
MKKWFMASNAKVGRKKASDSGLKGIARFELKGGCSEVMDTL